MLCITKQEANTMQQTSTQQRSYVAPSGKEADFSLDIDTMSFFLPMSKRNTLFSQSLSNILKGPVYLGARLGFPNLSSLKYTNFATRRDFGTNREALNFRVSSTSGMKAEALDLDKLS